MNFGRVGFVMEGDWSAAVTYDTLSVVLYEGAVYAAKRMSAGSEPSTHPADWMLWVGSPVVSAEQTEAGYDLTITNGDGTTSVVHLLNGQITEAELTSALSGLREAFNANIAEGYSSSSVYSEGGYCLYNNVLYRCKTDILSPEAWDSTHWDAASLADDVQDLSENLYNNKVDAITSNASGEIVTIADGADNLPVKNLSVSLLPVQSGSGDPSPSNIRPISGWTGVDIYATGKNLIDWDSVLLSSKTARGITYQCSNGVVKVTGTATSACCMAFDNGDVVNYSSGLPLTNAIKLPAGSYYCSHTVVYGTNIGGTGSATGNGRTTAFDSMFTLPNGGYIRPFIAVDNGSSINIEKTIYVYPASAGVPTNPEKYVGTTIPIDWTDEAGTVYGGSLDLTTGVLTVRNVVYDGGAVTWVKDSASYKYGTFYFQADDAAYYNANSVNAVSSIYKSVSTNGATESGNDYCWIRFLSTNNRQFQVKCTENAEMTAADFTTAMTGQQFMYQYRTPLTYQLTPIQVSTLIGNNSFWSNGNGELSLEYRADTKLYIENLTKPSEDDMVANANIASGKFFMVGNRLFISTVAIAQGETIVVGTNCSEVSLADALNQINS